MIKVGSQKNAEKLDFLSKNDIFQSFFSDSKFNLCDFSKFAHFCQEISYWHQILSVLIQNTNNSIFFHMYIRPCEKKWNYWCFEFKTLKV